MSQHNWPEQVHQQYLVVLDERDEAVRKAELMELGLQQLAAGKTIDEWAITDFKAFANAWLDWVERVLKEEDGQDQYDDDRRTD